VSAAREMPSVTFLINGDGAARATLESSAADLSNVMFAGYVAPDRLGELLATGDLHVAGLGSVSVPSKTYSIMAAGRPVVAAIDADTAVPRILADSRGGLAVAPDDLVAFVDAVRSILDDPEKARQMGELGREWVIREASPRAVGVAYDALIADL